MSNLEVIPASFRDPDGFVFRQNGTVYRQINKSYSDTWQQLEESKLLSDLVSKGLLLAHEESSEVAPFNEGIAHKVIKPTQLPFISYPYEWSFSQLKSAALLTLEVQEAALSKGFSLKDASAFNIQFIGTKPVFIDTLSFEPWEKGSPWVAYRQFCQHFVAPLALMAYSSNPTANLFRLYIDGPPLDIVRKLLPLRSMCKWGYLVHLHLHGRVQEGDSETSQGKVAKGKAINSEGVTGKAVWGQIAKWVNYWGPIGDKTVGVAIFDHPDNPRHPTTWMTRIIGMVNVNPFGKRAFKRGEGAMKLKKGESVTFAYRFYFHEGSHEEINIPKHYKKWSESFVQKALYK